MYAFIKRFRKADHIRQFTIEPTGDGWECRELEDSKTLRQTHYSDWHRVERARRSIDAQIAGLREHGWHEV